MTELRLVFSETWDLLGGTLLGCFLLGLLLAWCGVCTVTTVIIVAPIVAIVIVFCGLWILAMAGGTIPW